MALLATREVNPPALKRKSGWLITLSTHMAHVNNVVLAWIPPGTPRTGWCCSSLFILPLFLLILLFKDPRIYPPLRREAGMWEDFIKVTFKSEICCLDISRHSLICVPRAWSFLLTFPVHDVAMAPCSPGTAHLLLFVTICLTPFSLRSQTP